MINLNVPSAANSTDLQIALNKLGVATTHYNLELHATSGTLEEITEAADLLATYDFQAGVIKDVKNRFETGIQKYLNVVAKEAGYDDIISACSFAAVANPYQADSISFLEWRGAVWTYAFKQVDKVATGKRDQPTLAELVAELPVRS